MTPRVTLALVIGAALAPLLAGPAFGARGPSTREERDRAVRVAHLLESSPWTDEAKEGRRWLGSFLAEVPDITVEQCKSLLGTPEERTGIPIELIDQVMYSGAAYILEHPGAGAGSTETLVAALDGTLAAYWSWKSQGSIPAVPRLDELLKMQSAGQLESYVRAQARHCT
jgi:hypothetical protein